MATFKIVVQHQRSDGFYPVYIRLTHNRKVLYIKTDKMVAPKGIVKGSHDVRDSFVLNSLTQKMDSWISRLNKEDIEKWSAEEVRDFLLSNDSDVCFSDFAREYILSLSRSLKPQSLRNYNQALSSIEKYCGTDQIMFSDLTTKLVQGWIDSMVDSKSKKHFYPTFLKKMFLAGVANYNDYDKDIIRIKVNPWPRLSIEKRDKPNKKAITMEDCRKIFSVPPSSQTEQLALDVCKMILCLAGINVADLYEMQKDDYFSGILHYKRQKTKTVRDDEAYIEMKVPDMLLPTFEKYFACKDDPYLFMFHKNYKSSMSMSSNIGLFLKHFCKNTLNDYLHISPYTFRHTWATIAQNDLGASYEEIGFALNHISTHKVTMGYVKPDFSRAWELNEKVVEKIFFTNDPSRRTQEYHAPVFEKVEETFELCADAYFMGEVVGHVDGKGYRNTDEGIQQLMDNINDTVPKNCTIQIKVKNVTKNQTKYFERMRDIK